MTRSPSDRTWFLITEHEMISITPGKQTSSFWQKFRKNQCVHQRWGSLRSTVPEWQGDRRLQQRDRAGLLGSWTHLKASPLDRLPGPGAQDRVSQSVFSQTQQASLTSLPRPLSVQISSGILTRIRHGLRHTFANPSHSEGISALCIGSRPAAGCCETETRCSR